LRKAGFDQAKPRKFTKLIVTKHFAFPGYIFKLYLDAQRYHKNLPEYHFWILRAEGANKIRRVIRKEGLESLFKVPQKWIYAIPANSPSIPSGYFPKHFILVEEDMNILSSKDNKIFWASSYVTPKLLEGLYSILNK